MEYNKFNREQLIEIAELQAGQIALLEEKIELLKELNTLLLRTNHKFVDIFGEDNHPLHQYAYQKSKNAKKNDSLE